MLLPFDITAGAAAKELKEREFSVSSFGYSSA
jgi:hypothetical protein